MYFVFKRHRVLRLFKLKIALFHRVDTAADCHLACWDAIKGRAPNKSKESLDFVMPWQDAYLGETHPLRMTSSG
jgi:hypothetical protein